MVGLKEAFIVAVFSIVFLFAVIFLFGLIQIDPINSVLLFAGYAPPITHGPGGPGIPDITGQTGGVLTNNGQEVYWTSFPSSGGGGGGVVSGGVTSAGFGIRYTIDTSGNQFFEANVEDLNTVFLDRNGFLPLVRQSVSFLDLNDTPNTYAGDQNKLVRVNKDANGLEYIDANSAITDTNNASFLGGQPPSYYASANAYVPYSGAINNLDLGAHTITAQSFVSTVATGTQPYSTTSTTLNSNLNADLLDGSHATSFVLKSGDTMTGPLNGTDINVSGDVNAFNLKSRGGFICNDTNCYLINDLNNSSGAETDPLSIHTDGSSIPTAQIPFPQGLKTNGFTTFNDSEDNPLMSINPSEEHVTINVQSSFEENVQNKKNKWFVWGDAQQKIWSDSTYPNGNLNLGFASENDSNFLIWSTEHVFDLPTKLITKFTNNQIDFEVPINLTGKITSDANTILFTDENKSFFGNSPDFPGFWGAGNQICNLYLGEPSDPNNYFGYGKSCNSIFGKGTGSDVNILLYVPNSDTSFLKISHPSTRTVFFSTASTSNNDAKFVLQNYKPVVPGGNSKDVNLVFSSQKINTADVNGTISYSASANQFIIDRDLRVVQNFYGNQIYGGMKYGNETSSTTITIPVSNVYHRIDFTIDGLNNGFSFSDGNLIASYPGVYQIIASMTFKGSAGSEYGMKVFVNDQNEDNCYRTQGATTQHQSVSANCNLRINVGDKINLRVADEQNPPQNIDIHNVNLTVLRVGN